MFSAMNLIPQLRQRMKSASGFSEAHSLSVGTFHPLAKTRTAGINQTDRNHRTMSGCCQVPGMGSFSAAPSLSPSEGERVRVRGLVEACNVQLLNSRANCPLTLSLSPSAGERERRTAATETRSQLCQLSQNFISNPSLL